MSFNGSLQLMLVLCIVEDNFEIYRIYAMASFFNRRYFHFRFWKISKCVVQSVVLFETSES